MFNTIPRHLRYTVITASLVVLGLLLMPTMATLDGEAGFDFLIFLGRFHIVVLHIPIGWLLLVPIADVLAKKFSQAGFGHAARVILLMGAISAVVAAVFGFTLATSDGYAGDTVTYHMWAGIITCTAAILACVLKEVSIVYSHHLLRVAYALCLSVVLVAITIGGHLGGALVQGEGYLSEKMPLALKNIMGIESHERQALSLDTPIYAGIIQPILKQRCIACHSAEKVKGRYQMDSYRALLKGGKSQKVAITPGALDHSELFRRISLARDEEDVMPPKKKTPLEPSETALLEWWIEVGSPEQLSINELSADQYPSHIADVIDGLINSTGTSDEPQRPAIEVAQLQLHSDELKKQFGIDVVPVSQNLQDGLMINAINLTAELNDAAWNALTPLSPFIISMDLGGVAFEGDDLKYLSIYSQLQTLYLHNTAVKDINLVHLSHLSTLRTLNLFDTGVSDDAVSHLLKLRALKTLYLHQTKISETGLKRIQKALPRCKIVVPV
jgi:uncharacterized membrane protein